MAYYTALITAWNSATQPPAGVTGTALTAQMTTGQKIAAVNGWVVASNPVDVQPSAVKGQLLLDGVYFTLKLFASGAMNGNATHDQALGAAMSLIEMIDMPNAPVFEMSNPTKYAKIQGMLDALLAQELAASGTTGVTQATHDDLLNLSATTLPWWQANGYTAPIGFGDTETAGLV